MVYTVARCLLFRFSCWFEKGNFLLENSNWIRVLAARCIRNDDDLWKWNAMKRKRKENNNNQSGGRKPTDAPNDFTQTFEYFWILMQILFWISTDDRRMKKRAYVNRSILYLLDEQIDGSSRAARELFFNNPLRANDCAYILASCFWKCVRQWNGYLPNEYVNWQQSTRTRKGLLPYRPQTSEM